MYIYICHLEVACFRGFRSSVFALGLRPPGPRKAPAAPGPSESKRDDMGQLGARLCGSALYGSRLQAKPLPGRARHLGSQLGPWRLCLRPSWSPRLARGRSGGSLGGSCKSSAAPRLAPPAPLLGTAPAVQQQPPAVRRRVGH